MQFHGSINKQINTLIMILLDFSLFAASVDELLCNKQVFSLEKVDFDTACPECDSFNDDVSGY